MKKVKNVLGGSLSEGFRIEVGTVAVTSCSTPGNDVGKDRVVKEGLQGKSSNDLS